MKKLLFLSVAIFSLICFCACGAPEPYTGEPIAPSSASDSEPWPKDTFFASAPPICETVNSVSVNDDKTTYSFKITNISYEDFVKWAQAMKKCGVSPIGSGEYGLDGTPIDGMASFNGETKQFTVISTWTDKESPLRVANHDLSISFIKKK